MNISLKEVISGILITVLSAAVIYMGTQLNKIDKIEQTMIELPTTTTKKLDDTINELQAKSGANDMRLKLLIMKLKDEDILNETDVNILLDTR